MYPSNNAVLDSDSLRDIHLSNLHLLYLLQLVSIMSERVKEVAKEELEQAKVLASDAVRSGAYLYPLKVSKITR